VIPSHDVALLLVGHGSARHPEAVRPIFDLALAVRARGRFAEVAAFFLKASPGPEQALGLVTAPWVVVVPVFAGQGYYTGTLIPKALELAGPLTRRAGRVIVYTAPVGGHARLPAVLAGRAAAFAVRAGLNPAAASLLLIAHGSSRPGGGAIPKAIAAAIDAERRFAEVALGFLEQEPRAAAWPSLVRRGTILALPLLVAQGLHASQDIPPLFGLTPGQCGPAAIAGRRVHLVGGLGAEPELVDIVIDTAETALRQSTAPGPD